MRTTIDLDDDLLKQAKMVAIERNQTLRELISRGVRREISEGGLSEARVRRVAFPILPIFETGPIHVTAEVIRESEHEDDLRRSGLLP